MFFVSAIMRFGHVLLGLFEVAVAMLCVLCMVPVLVLDDGVLGQQCSVLLQRRITSFIAGFDGSMAFLPGGGRGWYTLSTASRMLRYTKWATI